MIQIIGIELFKIFKKWRSYIAFLAIAVIVPIVQIAMYVEGNHYLEFLTQSIQQVFVFTGNFLNGYLISHILLGALMIHIPFLVTLVAGDLLAGEATAGTYRMLLTRPVSRWKIVTGKFIAGVIYTNLVVLWLAFISLGLGIAIFGTGELLVLSGDITIFAKNDIMWRFVCAYGFAALSMTTVASLAFLLSSMVENAIGPIVGTMAIIIVFVIVSNLNVGLFKDIRPFLFTYYMNGWRLFFETPMDSAETVKSVSVLFAHVVVFFGATLLIFKRKDILS
ncbi:MAG: ABC transporter permease [Ignavibacteriales bacterium]|nr:ABC transporter permease [Ignavibacteriales bacterium]